MTRTISLETHEEFVDVSIKLALGVMSWWPEIKDIDMVLGRSQQILSYYLLGQAAGPDPEAAYKEKLIEFILQKHPTWTWNKLLNAFDVPKGEDEST